MKQKTKLKVMARNASFRVEFITTGREIVLYTNALYMAMMWGWAERIEVEETLEEE